MQMEEFYATAKDADYLIYNSTIDGELQTVDQLLGKCDLLKDFKAVKRAMYGALPVIFIRRRCLSEPLFRTSIRCFYMERMHRRYIYIRWHNKGVFEFMNRDRNKIIRYTVSFILLGIALLLFLGWNICAGSVSVSLSDILKSVAGQEIEATAESILWEIRMPRALTAAILGGALAFPVICSRHFSIILLPVLLYSEFHPVRSWS